MYMKNLVIGLGEIGSAIQEILECEGHDPFKNKIAEGQYDVIHICLPYNKNFIKIVKEYQKIFSPKLTIIHSTVPIGTNDKLKSVASPCRGIHPYLKEGIITFDKGFGGEYGKEASLIFKDKLKGNPIYADNRSIEAGKLWCTTQYGLNIILEKEIYKYCKENNLDFNIVYTLWNKSYNEGYEKLGCPQFKKYILEHREGKIGGHCVLPNLPLLKGKIANFIKKINDSL